MSADVAPMSATRRREIYARRGGSMTSRQWRRHLRKTRHAAAPFGSGTRAAGSCYQVTCPPWETVRPDGTKV